MAHSSESRPKNESYQKGFQELDHMAAIVAGTLIQLFGDEGIDQTAIVENCSTSMNKKKRGACSEIANGIDISSGERIMKKRRYRSIDNLYMATKPINFLEGKKYYS
ncbi:hypothetical protein Pfo_018637 [Paulownia fortunei]|nr:hypothetical protein Pfo_018637 [Paulownia fortunei]